MASRYLRQMEVFNRRGLNSLRALLSASPQPFSETNLHKLSQQVDKLQDRYDISNDRRHYLEQQIGEYVSQNSDEGEEMRLGILSIMLNRYAKRGRQYSLFDDESINVEPTRPLSVDAGVAEGARIHLLHKFDRPCYFGVDTLCDAGSENAEQFLRLAAGLVSQSEIQIIRRGKDPVIPNNVQHELLRERASKLIDEWDFPHCDLVRQLAEQIAGQCLMRSNEGNAPLGGGAIGIGVLQDDFDLIPQNHPVLAQVIKFGVAYNALVLVPNHRTKNRVWCLIELGGVLLLNYGLTLKRGGFIERRVSDLVRILDQS